MAVTVLLVDDVEEVRAVVGQALRLRGGFDIVAEAADGAAAVRAARDCAPDVVVLDLGLPDLAGHELVTRVREVVPAATIVIYTGSVTADRAGISDRVDAFVRKDQDVRYLVDLLADLSRPRDQTATLELGPALTDVRRARLFMAEHCGRWGCLPKVADAELVVTELVTNALLHAGGWCELRAGYAEPILRIEVEDRGGGAPDLQVADRNAEHGRGLLLVSALCTAWGIDVPGEGRKLVWAELLVPRQVGREPHRGSDDQPSAASAALSDDRTSEARSDPRSEPPPRGRAQACRRRVPVRLGSHGRPGF